MVVNDGFILVGSNGDGLILKIDGEGNEIWRKTYGLSWTEEVLYRAFSFTKFVRNLNLILPY